MSSTGRPASKGSSLRGAVALGILGAVIFGGLGCASTGGAEVVHGEPYVGQATDAMAREGVVFSPYPMPVWLGAESTSAHMECIQAVNEAAYQALRERYTIVAPSMIGRQVDDQPRWMRAPSGPRAAVTIKSFRCGEVTGGSGYVRAPSPFGFEAPPASDEPAAAKPEPTGQPSEVTLTVYDRRSGQEVIEVVGRDGSSSGVDAVRRAARAAAASLDR